MRLRDWPTRHQSPCREPLEELYTNGAGKMIHFACIKQLTSEHGSRNLAFAIFMFISPAWPRAPLFGSKDSLRSSTASLFMPTIFSCQTILRLDSSKFSQP